MLPKALSYEMLELFLDYRNLSIFQSKGLIPVTPSNLGDVNVRLSRNRYMAKHHGITLDLETNSFKTLFGIEIGYVDIMHQFVITKDNEHYYFDAETGKLISFTKAGTIHVVTRHNKSHTYVRFMGTCTHSFDAKGRLVTMTEDAPRTIVIDYINDSFDIKEEHHTTTEGIVSYAWSAIRPSSVVAWKKDTDGTVTAANLLLEGKF